MARSCLRVSDGLLRELVLDTEFTQPRLVHVGLVRYAQRDAELKTQELMREKLDGFDPAEARADLDRMLRLRW